jgi:hypothetical protein
MAGGRPEFQKHARMFDREMLEDENAHGPILRVRHLSWRKASRMRRHSSIAASASRSAARSMPAAAAGCVPAGPRSLIRLGQLDPGSIHRIRTGLVRVDICIRLGGSRPRDETFRPLLLQKALHALDRVAVVVEELTNGAEQHDIGGAVVAAPPGPLQRPDLRKARLPEPQHVLRHREMFGDFADRAESVRALLHGDSSNWSADLIQNARLAQSFALASVPSGNTFFDTPGSRP